MADDARGRFVWYDLMTSDPKGAEAFYAEVAGWGTQIWDAMPYTMWTVRGNPLGGVMELPAGAGAPPHWLAYIGSPDVDATVRTAESLGARTHVQPRDIPTVGRFAVLADPQGAAFAVFTPSDAPPGHDGEPALGEFSWHELATTDYRAAWDFYQTLFGWEKNTEHDMGPMGVYLTFRHRGREIGGMFNKPPEMPAPPHWLQYIHVDSVDRVVKLVAARGGQVLNGPMDVPGGDRIAQCLDPQGAAFALHSKG